MNWLAHIFLSEKNIDFQIGNYLADPLKGRIWEGASISLQKGMRIHKLIDSYTDSHILFKSSKERLGKKGLLKAVVVDLTYDYLLTKNWQNFSNISKELFLNEFYKQAMSNLPTLPLNAQTYLKRLIEFDLLNKYNSLEDLYKAFERVDKRISKRLLLRDKTINYFNIVSTNIENLEKDFLEFFPQLCNTVRENVDESKLSHWKI